MFAITFLRVKTSCTPCFLILDKNSHLSPTITKPQSHHLFATINVVQRIAIAPHVPGYTTSEYQFCEPQNLIEKRTLLEFGKDDEQQWSLFILYTHFSF